MRVPTEDLAGPAGHLLRGRCPPRYIGSSRVRRALPQQVRLGTGGEGSSLAGSSVWPRETKRGVVV